MNEKIDNRVLVILGMHRAGTSLATKLASKLGVDLGNNLIAPRPDNLDGPYEQIEIMEVSKSINRRLDRQVMGPLGAAPFPPGWIDRPEIIEYQEQLRKILKREIATTRGIFGFKDPNTIRIFPLWQRVFDDLGVDVRYLLSLRHPVAVTRSLVKRDRITAAAGELLWCVFYAEIIDYLNADFDCVVSYEGWYEQPVEQLQSMIEKLDLPAGDSDIEKILSQDIKPSLTHHTAVDSEIMLPVTRKLYAQLKSHAHGEPVDGLLDTAREVLNARQMLEAWVESLEKHGSQSSHRRSSEKDTLNRTPQKKNLESQDRELRVEASDRSGDLQKGGNTCIVMPSASEDSEVIASGLPIAEFRLWLMAEELVSTGSEVTVLFPGETAFLEHLEQIPRTASSEKIKIVIDPLPAIPCRQPHGQGPLALALEDSYNVYEYLKVNAFNLIFFPDTHGIGYFSLSARDQGIRFAQTSIVLLLIQPSSMLREANKDITWDLLDLVRNEMENTCLQLAEKIVCTDSVDVAWLRNHGWQAPENVDLLPLPIPPGLHQSAEPGEGTQDMQPARALAYYGNLDQKSGFHIFRGALSRLLEQGVVPEHVYLLSTGQQAKKWVKAIQEEFEGLSLSFHENLSRSERLEILTRPEVVAVVPVSHQCASGEALECIAAGARAIISEHCPHLILLPERQRESVATRLHPHYLAEKFKKVLAEGQLPLRMSWSRREINNCWDSLGKNLSTRKLAPDWLSTIERNAEQDAVPKRPGVRRQLKVDKVSSDVEPGSRQAPEVSICLIHFERPDFVNQTIESLELQSYKNFEVILVDDGSKGTRTLENLDAVKARFEKRGWQVVRQPNLSPGAARNRAASLARGQYLLFMDDDNYAKPHQIETFMHVAKHTGANAITCFRDAFVGNEFPPLEQLAKLRIPALGSSISVSNFINCFGDTNALIRKTAYLAVGGYNEQHRTGKEDYEFFCKLALNGFRLITIPEALYWYREHPVKRKRHHYDINAGTLTVMNAFSEAIPFTQRDSMLFARALSDKMREEKLTPDKLEARLRFLGRRPVWLLRRLASKVLSLVLPRR